MILYNTLTKSEEEFVPSKPGEVKMYSCGPTVYDFIHIGNARPICVFDTLRRYLIFLGYEVFFAQNFTDVDDKIIKKANAQGKSCAEIAKQFIKEYETDAAGLNILPPTHAPKATENIEAMQEIIKKLCELGLAYSKNGNVYFRAREFKGYGKLSGMPLDELSVGARIELSEEKEDGLDFVLWKAAKPGEVYWESPWGKGRPGWHIECSAMIEKVFGGRIDIHCGGRDLIFPHHENEIAQTEGHTGQPLANYWLHNGHVNISNQKMSKSLGNFLTVREIAKRYGYMPIRLMMLQSHYRAPINYGEEVMAQNLAALQRVNSCKEKLEEKLQQLGESEAKGCEPALLEASGLLRFKAQFNKELENDFNTAGAVGVLFELIKEINTTFAGNKTEPPGYLKAANLMLSEFLQILGLELKDIEPDLDEETKNLIEQRQKARAERDFKLADEIRNSLERRGILLEDTPTGVKVKKQKMGG